MHIDRPVEHVVIAARGGVKQSIAVKHSSGTTHQAKQEIEFECRQHKRLATLSRIAGRGVDRDIIDDNFFIRIVSRRIIHLRPPNNRPQSCQQLTRRKCLRQIVIGADL